MSKKQSKEILWNIINSVLAGLLVLLGAFSTGDITLKSFCFATITACLVAVNQFKDYWETQKNEYSSTKMFSFVKF